jgi:hypothetical protein
MWCALPGGLLPVPALWVVARVVREAWRRQGESESWGKGGVTVTVTVTVAVRDLALQSTKLAGLRSLHVSVALMALASQALQA